MTRVTTSLVLAEGAGLLQHVIDQRRLAVVDVGDDGDITDVGTLHWFSQNKLPERALRGVLEVMLRVIGFSIAGV